MHFVKDMCWDISFPELLLNKNTERRNRSFRLSEPNMVSTLLFCNTEQIPENRFSGYEAVGMYRGQTVWVKSIGERYVDQTANPAKKANWSKNLRRSTKRYMFEVCLAVLFGWPEKLRITDGSPLNCVL